MSKEIVVVQQNGARAEQLNDPHPEDPAVGKWYWLKLVKHEEPLLACITHMGSNYMRMKTVEESTYRIHENEFFEKCQYEPNPDVIIDREVDRQQGTVRALMAEVRAVTARLGVGHSAALTDGSGETRALATINSSTQPVEGYKAALIKAKEETLPDLFKQIKETNAVLATWMGAKLIPLKAQAGSLDGAIEAITNRIFSVELYAGLTEEIVQIKNGEPAEMTEPVHVMQRRAYMDEECLAEYETGGMEFKNLQAFDKWLAKPSNLDRLIPFKRCIVAFRVRREVKERQIHSIGDYFHFIEQAKLEMLTFLYIRNGKQLFRLNTSIDFGAKLFPDMNKQVLSSENKMWAKINSGVQELLTEDEYFAIRDEKLAEEAAVKKKQEDWDAEIETKDEKWKDENSWRRPSGHFHWWDRDNYHEYTRESVYYDDITTFIHDEMQRHNRLVLVLQGLLDRSPVLHPHPPWSLWNSDSFKQALVLHYDDSRALTTGDRPDFEAYRQGLNAQIKVGSVTIGQQRAWDEVQEELERRRRYRGLGNYGPGKFAYVVAVSPRTKNLSYQWTRKRQTITEDEHKDNREIGCKFSTGIENVFNVSAYKPGDFRKFFADPRTRADYLQWAHLLLEAEEFHAGNREVADVKPLPPRAKTADGSWQYQRRKRNKALVGQAVRLCREVCTKGKKHYKEGSLWRVTNLYRGQFTITGILPDGQFEESIKTEDDEGLWGGRRVISGMGYNDLDVAPEIPPQKKKKGKNED